MKSSESIDICWVCVLRDEKSDKYHVRLSGDPGLCRQEREENLQLVYSREFPDTLAAAGYRIALSNISKSSLKRIIARAAQCENSGNDTTL